VAGLQDHLVAGQRQLRFEQALRLRLEDANCSNSFGTFDCSKL
jgi:Tfp pilus assembly protein PilF